MSSKAHQAHIAPSEPMTSLVQLETHIAQSEPLSSINQQGSSLGLCPTSPTLNPHCKPSFMSLNLCQVLSDGRQTQISGWWPGLAWWRVRIFFLSQQHVVSILTTKPSCQMWGLHPFHQLKQKLWNPTNYSHRPNTANQTNHSCHLIQTALLRANLRKSTIQQLF